MKMCLARVKWFSVSAVGALALSGVMAPVPPLASNVTVTTTPVTLKVYVQVPVSPCRSVSVPETRYGEPAAVSGPGVLSTPLGVMVKPKVA
jgi:hypothetical protein